MWGFYNFINIWCITFELIRKLVNEDSDRFLMWFQNNQGDSKIQL